MGKMIFLDIDGTIRDFDGTIPASAVQAVRQARANGHEVLINTGRTYCRIDREILDIGFDGVSASYGAYVLYKGKCIAHRYFTQLGCIELMKDLLERHYVVEMANDKASYVLRENWEDYLIVGRRICENITLDEKQWEIPVAVDSLLDVPEVEKLIVFSSELSRREIMSKWGYSVHISDLGVPHTEKWAVEITPDYITKAEGIRQILRAEHRKQENVIAVGDSDNDIEMLRFAQTGIAMGNGTSRVKEAADYVTGPVREDGLMEAFLHLGLIWR